MKFLNIFIINNESAYFRFLLVVMLPQHWHYSTSEGSSSDLMTVINYFQEHLLNNFPCRIRSLSLRGWERVRDGEKYLENANVECSKHASHLIHNISQAMISLTQNNIHTQNSFYSANDNDVQKKSESSQNLCLPQFLNMSKQLVIQATKIMHKEFHKHTIFLKNKFW